MRGDVIAVRTLAGAEMARGLANYSGGRGAADRAQAIDRRSSAAGLANEPELIHRDNLVLA